MDCFLRRTKDILALGFPPFVGDISMSFVVILLNNQVMRYYGATELAIFGICGNIFSTFQTFSYGIGNAAQPLMAQNLGAGKIERVGQTAWFGIRTSVVLGVILTAVMLLFPAQVTRIYMDTSEDVVQMAVPLLRQFFLSIPTELEDAAMIDGCGYPRIYYEVIMKNSKPAIMTLVLFCFMGTWNDFLRPMLYLNKTELWTMSLGLSKFKGNYVSMW